MIKGLFQKFMKWINREHIIRYLDLKIVAMNTLVLILLIITFRQTYHTAELINFELQFKNYLASLNNPQNYDMVFSNFTTTINQNVTKIITQINNTNIEPLKFPSYLKYLLMVSLFFIFEIAHLWYIKVKRWKDNIFSTPELDINSLDINKLLESLNNNEIPRETNNKSEV